MYPYQRTPYGKSLYKPKITQLSLERLNFGFLFCQPVSMGKTLEQPLGSGCVSHNGDPGDLRCPGCPGCAPLVPNRMGDTPGLHGLILRRKNDETQQFLESPKNFPLKTNMTGWKIPILLIGNTSTHSWWIFQPVMFVFGDVGFGWFWNLTRHDF